MVHASKPSDEVLFRSIGFVNRIKAIYHRSRCNTLILISNLRNMITSTIQHKYCSSEFHNSSKSLYSSGIYLMHMQTEGGVDWKSKRSLKLASQGFDGSVIYSSEGQRGVGGGGEGQVSKLLEWPVSLNSLQVYITKKCALKHIVGSRALQ